MRVADYVIDQIYKAGCEHIFLVTGGGAMHLNDAVAVSDDKMSDEYLLKKSNIKFF